MFGHENGPGLTRWMRMKPGPKLGLADLPTYSLLPSPVNPGDGHQSLALVDAVGSPSALVTGDETRPRLATEVVAGGDRSARLDLPDRTHATDVRHSVAGILDHVTVIKRPELVEDAGAGSVRVTPESGAPARAELVARPVMEDDVDAVRDAVPLHLDYRSA